ncbi:MAG: pilin [Pseudomonadota bacterium]|nr:pilin [Pseudomonadota bacterium]
MSGDPTGTRQPATRKRAVGIVIALILILAAIVLIAVFAHLHRVHTIRAQVGAGIATADGTRVAVAIYHAQTGAWPPDNTAAGLLSPSAVNGRYVTDVHIDDGRIVITLGAQVHRKVRGDHVTLTPYLDSALVRWHCASTDIRADLLPESCR